MAPVAEMSASRERSRRRVLRPTKRPSAELRVQKPERLLELNNTRRCAAVMAERLAPRLVSSACGTGARQSCGRAAPAQPCIIMPRLRLRAPQPIVDMAVTWAAISAEMLPASPGGTAGRSVGAGVSLPTTSAGVPAFDTSNTRRPER